MTTKKKEGEDTQNRPKHDLSNDILIENTIDVCLNEFFSGLNSKISEYDDVDEFSRRLDYIKMKRFLLTAYNNLAEMDASISQGRAKKPYQKLLRTQKIHDELAQYAKKPLAMNYEKIFLVRQSAYLCAKSEIARLEKLIDFETGRVLILAGVLERTKEYLSKLEKNSPEYEKINQSYKKNNREYVDRLHSQSETKAELQRLKSLLSRFESSHLIEFSRGFEAKMAELAKRAVTILDVVSYEFDTILWDEAKNSKVIRKFFEESKIEGSYSSKTFLKYYLKSLPDAKSDEIKGLRDLLSYLDTACTRNIIIVGANSEDVSRYRFLVESTNKDYFVIETTNPDKISLEYKNIGLDCIIIEHELKNTNGVEVIEGFWEEFGGARDRVVVMIIFSAPDYEAINRAGRAGVKYFFMKSHPDMEFAAKIQSIV